MPNELSRQQECHQKVCDILGNSKVCGFDESNTSESFRECVNCYVSVSRIKRDLAKAIGSDNEHFEMVLQALNFINRQLASTLKLDEPLAF